MAKHIFSSAVILIILGFLLSCGSKQQSESTINKDAINESTEDSENPSASEDPEDPESTDSPASVTMNSCPGKACCNENQKCKKKCEALFIEWENKKKCFQSLAHHVDEMYTLMTKILRKPNEDNVTDLDLKVLHSVLSLSEKAWLIKINKYSRKSAQAILFWLASQSKQDVFSYRSSKSPVRDLLIALFRQNSRSLLVDDNALLSGLKEPINKKKKKFFEVANQKGNIRLLSFIHEYIVADHLCDYPINHPHPARSFYTEALISTAREQAHSACVLAVYCHLTGSYSAGEYVAQKKGQALRKDLAGELEKYKEEIENFIQDSHSDGGLGVEDSPDDWTDSSCVKLTELWDDGNLKFGL